MFDNVLGARTRNSSTATPPTGLAARIREAIKKRKAAASGQVGGTAVPRDPNNIGGTDNRRPTTPAPVGSPQPPDATRDASNATLQAIAAAMRQRRRGAGGNSILAGRTGGAAPAKFTLKRPKLSGK